MNLLFISLPIKSTLYFIGVTSDLSGRILQHKQKTYKGFSAKYDCNKLVYFEQFQWIQDAIDREKQLSGFTAKKDKFSNKRKSSLE
ncbi:GIY-YIG nuclease family protein [Mucilaginibacter sp.]|uniref:GIY-YIG nuclease family protein n=1 Tax=Mucilaginibacter sp. TaxID=1882438 RepID=UPI0035BC6788